MGWWTNFDYAEVEIDFARLAGAGFDSWRTRHLASPASTVATETAKNLLLGEAGKEVVE